MLLGETLTSLGAGGEGGCNDGSGSSDDAIERCNRLRGFGNVMKVEFGDKGTLYLKDVNWGKNNCPNAPRYRWSLDEPWHQACSHSSQCPYGHWFFFKTSVRNGDCESVNYENTVMTDAGFVNRDGADFFPIVGASQCQNH